MSKKKVKASELVEADVQFVSIVGKGANRIPIRLTKSEEGNKMRLDISKIFKSKKSNNASYVAAVIVRKGADIEAAKARIQKAGFSVEKQEDTGEAVIFHQSEIAEDAIQYLMRADEDTVLHLVTEKKMEMMDYQTQSFAELFNKAGVLPSMMMATDLLKEVFMNILYGDVDSPEEAASAIKTAVKEFSNIVTEMAANIPVSAFKMEDPSLNGQPKEGETEVTDKKAETPKTDPAPAAPAAVAKSEGGDDKAVAETEAAAPAAPAEPAKKSEDPMEIIAQGLLNLTEMVTTMKSSLDEKITALEGRVNETAQVAKSANEALSGATAATPPADKPVKAVKSEEKTFVLKDTGFSRARAY